MTTERVIYIAETLQNENAGFELKLNTCKEINAPIQCIMSVITLLHLVVRAFLQAIFGTKMVNLNDVSAMIV